MHSFGHMTYILYEYIIACALQTLDNLPGVGGEYIITGSHSSMVVLDGV